MVLPRRRSDAAADGWKHPGRHAARRSSPVAEEHAKAPTSQACIRPTRTARSTCITCIRQTARPASTIRTVACISAVRSTHIYMSM